MRRLSIIFTVIISIIILQNIFFTGKVCAVACGYTVKNGYIKDIEPYTLYSDFIKNINCTDSFTVTDGDKTISQEDMIKTGQELREVINKYTLVVTGDTTGDGKTDIRDMMQINMHRLGKVKLKGAKLLAADINNDGSINIKDMMTINKYRLKKTNTAGKIIVEAPKNVQVSTTGVVTWENSSNATGYEISLNNRNWEKAENGINYLSKITEKPGKKQVFIRAINSDKNKYTDSSASVEKELTVNTITITSNNESMGTVSKKSVNVISGSTFETNKNALTIKGKTKEGTSKTVETITATEKEGYKFNGWSSTSGTINKDITINAIFEYVKKAVEVPKNVQVSTAGIVTWENSNNATGYEISLDNKTWETARSGVDYLSKIIATTGKRTIYVRAINSDTNKFITPSSNAVAEVTVNTITITSNNESMGTVSKKRVNVISGSTFETNNNTLTIKGKTKESTSKTIETITATVKEGHKFNGWSSTSGTINKNITINATFEYIKTAVEEPKNIQVTTAGIVTWESSSNATGYEISVDNTNWSEAENGVDYLSRIIAAAGKRTVYVRAINSDTEKFISPSNSIVAEVTVSTMSLSSNDDTKGAVSKTNYNVINGATFSTSNNKLIVKGKNLDGTNKNLATITATAKANYIFSSWSKGSGEITENIAITASFIEQIYTISLDNQGATTEGTVTIYEQYSKGYYLDSEAKKQMKTNENGIEVPTKTGFTFKGYFSEVGGGTQYITETGMIVADVSNTTFTANGTLYAKWEQPSLMASRDSTSYEDFLRTDIKREKIKKITFATSKGNHSSTDENCYDVSAKDGSEDVLLWVDKIDNNGYYEIVIGQEGGVIANQDCSSLFHHIGDSIQAEINLNNFNTSNVTNMKEMFGGCRELINLDVSNLDTSNVTNMRKMFDRCIELTSLNLSKFDTSNVTDMNGMFGFCRGIRSLDVSKFKTSNVTDMGSMFLDCFGLTSLDLSKFDTLNVTNMENMFMWCSGLTSLDLSKFNTSNVTNMSYMFDGCSELTSLDVSKFTTSNVTDMGSMFYGCSKITNLDVSKFTTSNVTDMGNMFYGCSSLTNLDVSKFNTFNVTNMENMFMWCSNLTSLDVSKFNTSNVTNMYSMFCGCSGLTSLDLSKFDTSNITNMTNMFYGCSGLTNLDLISFNTEKVTNMDDMFCGCEKLTKIIVSSDFTTSAVTSSDNMFYNCTKLIGGAGTPYNSNHIDATYARIDLGNSKPGYFTGGNNGIALTINNTISVNVMEEYNETISIDEFPDSSIVNVSLDNKTLTVEGLKVGETSITFKVNGSNIKKKINIIVQAAHYEITNAADGQNKYHSKLKDVVATAQDNAIINVLDDVFENEDVVIDKNITLNIGNKTITYNSGIINITAGTTIIKGTGSIVCSEIKDLINLKNSATFKTEGSPLLKSDGNVIVGRDSSTVNLTGGYIVSSGGDWQNTSTAAIQMKSASKLQVSNTNVYVTVGNRNAITFSANSTGTCTISGNSKIGTGGNSTADGGYYSCINYNSTGKFILKDSATIYSNTWSTGGISVGAQCSLEFLDSSSIYSNAQICPYDKDMRGCLIINKSGCTVTFNSSGYFYNRGEYVAVAGTKSNKITATYNVTKGHFAAGYSNMKDGDNKAMFYQNGTYNTSYMSSAELPTSTTLYEMTDYKTVISLTTSIYKYNKSV